MDATEAVLAAVDRGPKHVSAVLLAFAVDKGVITLEEGEELADAALGDPQTICEAAVADERDGRPVEETADNRPHVVSLNVTEADAGLINPRPVPEIELLLFLDGTYSFGAEGRNTVTDVKSLQYG